MTTEQLGQFTDDNAERICAALRDEGIEHYTKSFGRIVRTLFAADWGTRIFVDRRDMARAMEIAQAIAPHGVRRKPPRPG